MKLTSVHFLLQTLIEQFSQPNFLNVAMEQTTPQMMANQSTWPTNLQGHIAAKWRMEAQNQRKQSNQSTLWNCGYWEQYNLRNKSVVPFAFSLCKQDTTFQNCKYIIMPSKPILSRNWCKHNLLDWAHQTKYSSTRKSTLNQQTKARHCWNKLFQLEVQNTRKNCHEKPANVRRSSYKHCKRSKLANVCKHARNVVKLYTISRHLSGRIMTKVSKGQATHLGEQHSSAGTGQSKMPL